MGTKLYHGTSTKFNKFKDEFQQGINFGRGFYLTEDEGEARTYSGDEGFVLECNGTFENPFNVRDAEHTDLLISVLGLDHQNVAAHSAPEDNDDPHDRESVYLQIVTELFTQGAGESYHEIRNGIRETLEGLGFDSIHDPARHWWIAFHSSQIEVTGHESYEYKSDARDPHDPNSWQKRK